MTFRKLRQQAPHPPAVNHTGHAPHLRTCQPASAQRHRQSGSAQLRCHRPTSYSSPATAVRAASPVTKRTQLMMAMTENTKLVCTARTSQRSCRRCFCVAASHSPRYSAPTPRSSRPALQAPSAPAHSALQQAARGLLVGLIAAASPVCSAAAAAAACTVGGWRSRGGGRSGAGAAANVAGVAPALAHHWHVRKRATLLRRPQDGRQVVGVHQNQTKRHRVNAWPEGPTLGAAPGRC